MQPTYQFTLQKEKQTSYNSIAFAVGLLHLITFIVLAVSQYPKVIGMAVFGMGIVTTYFLLYFFYQNNKFCYTFLDITFYLFALWWLGKGVYWMAVLIFIFSIFSTLSKQKIQIIFSAEQILYNALLKRSFNWADINNVVLKDGMLTIDFKNNKIIQQLIEEAGADETEFNGFCQKHIFQYPTPVT